MSAIVGLKSHDNSKARLEAAGWHALDYHRQEDPGQGYQPHQGHCNRHGNYGHDGLYTFYRLSHIFSLPSRYSPLNVAVYQGNKGATAIRLTCRSSVLTFVNSHLPAFDDGTQRRNLDFQYISQRLAFSSTLNNAADDTLSSLPVSKNDSSSMNSYDVTGTEKAYESDVLFWLVSQFSLRCLLVLLLVDL